MKNIISLMQSIGFTQYEAQVYLALLQQSHVSGYELARQSGVPASKIYQTLNRLIEKEMVLAVDQNPTKYVPVPPGEFLADYKNIYLDAVDQLSDKLDQIYAREELSDTYIWNLSDRDKIIRKVIEFIQTARTKMYLSIWDEELEALHPALEEVRQHDVQMTIVHYGSATLGYGKEYRHGREHTIRIERGGRRLALIVDDARVILAHFLEDGSSNAAWTANKGLVLLAKDYIIHDIYTIRIMQKYGDEALDIFAQV